MLILGLTGDIACGKSTVARMLAARGAALLDADLLVRELYSDPDFARRVAALFDNKIVSEIVAPTVVPPHEYSCGAQSDTRMRETASRKAESSSQVESRFLASDGTIDRAALGRLVFNDTDALKRLEELVHPAVAALRDRKIEALKSLEAPPRAVVLEAVKLIESGQARICGCVWLVVCAPKVQLQRLVSNRGLSEQEARERLAQQPKRESKRALLGDTPSTLIENNLDVSELEKAVEREWQRLLQAAP